jgi:hypothetical protein
MGTPQMVKSSLALLLVVVLFGCGSAAEKPVGDPEERVVAYLEKTVMPGKPVLVTELYNEVFTTEEEKQAVKRLYDALFQLPAFVATSYTNTGKIPTRQDITNHFNFRVPGTTDVLLRVLESDPRVPPFFKRDPSTGEITAIDVETIRNADRFGDALR